MGWGSRAAAYAQFVRWHLEWRWNAQDAERPKWSTAASARPADWRPLPSCSSGLLPPPGGSRTVHAVERCRPRAVASAPRAAWTARRSGRLRPASAVRHANGVGRIVRECGIAPLPAPPNPRLQLAAGPAGRASRRPPFGVDETTRRSPGVVAGAVRERLSGCGRRPRRS